MKVEQGKWFRIAVSDAISIQTSGEDVADYDPAQLGVDLCYVNEPFMWIKQANIRPLIEALELAEKLLEKEKEDAE